MQINPDLSFNQHKSILLQKAIAGEIDFDTYFNEVKELEEHFLRAFSPSPIEILADLASRSLENEDMPDAPCGYSNAL